MQKSQGFVGDSQLLGRSKMEKAPAILCRASASMLKTWPYPLPSFSKGLEFLSQKFCWAKKTVCTWILLKVAWQVNGMLFFFPLWHFQESRDPFISFSLEVQTKTLSSSSSGSFFQPSWCSSSFFGTGAHDIFINKWSLTKSKHTFYLWSNSWGWGRGALVLKCS